MEGLGVGRGSMGRDIGSLASPLPTCNTPPPSLPASEHLVTMLGEASFYR